MMLDLKCETCGKPVFHKQYGKRKHSFCSIECYRKWRKGKFAGADNWRWNSVERLCKRCGKAFFVQQNVIKDGKGLYCSRKCFRNRVSRTCKQCGKEFEAQVCEVRWNRGVFCTQDCYWKWMSINQRGNNHPTYLGDDYNRKYPTRWAGAIQESIRERDSYRCVACGASATDRRLDVHHIDYDKHNLSDRNLISLCRACHSKTNFHRPIWQSWLGIVTSEIYEEARYAG